MYVNIHNNTNASEKGTTGGHCPNLVHIYIIIR